MRFLPHIAFLLLPALVATAAAQSGAAYVGADKVNARSQRAGRLSRRHRLVLRACIETSRASLETQKSTTIIYVTDGEGTFAAGARTQRLTKGDVLVVPAGTTQSFTSVAHRSVT